jgi:hypothetical protein
MAQSHGFGHVRRPRNLIGAMSDFPREPRVSILNNDPLADLEALNLEDPDVVSAPEIIWYE